MAVTRIDCDWENNGFTAPIPVEDAFLITVHLRDCERHDLWLDGKPRRTGPLRRGDVSIYDLRTSPVVNSVSAFRNVHFYLPRATLDGIAEQEDIAPIDEMPNEPGLGMADPVIGGLALSVETMFARPHETANVFVDHVTSAVAAHLAQRFGTRGPSTASRDTRLSSRQERVAKELLAANLAGDIATADLAEACGLSVTRFRHGFRHATGAMPYQWLVERRIDRAIELLGQPGVSPAEAAHLAGFADVRHMRRVFRVTRGAIPARLRS